VDFKELEVSKGLSLYKELYSKVKKSYLSFNGLDFFNLRLFKGDFLLLKNRFDSKVFALVVNGSPKIIMTHYQAKDASEGIANSLGAILVDDNITNEQMSFFMGELKERLKDLNGPILAPLNAHFNLGFTLPRPDIDFSKISFLTAATSPGLNKVFYKNDFFNEERTFYSLSFKIKENPDMLEKLKKGILERPSEYTSESLSIFNYKKDIRDYNRIINASFKDHWNFFPLTFEEEWDLMKTALLVLNRDFVRFLVHKGERVALNMFMPDYHQVLKNGEDSLNFLRIQKYKNNPTRARGVTTCIIPEYRGKGLLRFVRYENLLNMFSKGVLEVESSYIDQDNINSIENTKSTGANLSHEFKLFSLN
jgi:hypothetical protein